MTIPNSDVKPEKEWVKKAIIRPIFKSYFKLPKDSFTLEREDDTHWYFRVKRDEVK